MIWPFRRRRRGQAQESLEVWREHQASVVRLEAARDLRRQAAEVSSSLRETRERNHFAEGFRTAMGGWA